MKAKLFLKPLIISICAFLFSTYSQSSTPAYRIFPGSNLQIQTWIAAHPMNPLIIAGIAITDVYPGGYTTGAYITTNGGLNWSCTNSIRDSLFNIIATVGDPSVIIDKNGVMIIVYTTGPPPGGSGFKVGLSYSTNNGLYWSKTSYIPGVDSSDKVMSATDNLPSSPYFGRSYVVYSERRKGGIYFSSTSNSGVTWDSAKRICPPFKEARTGSSITTGPLGEIYVSWPHYDTTAHSNFIGFARSTDGGASWYSKDTAISVDLVSNAHRVNLLGTRLNGLPVINTDKSGGSRNGTIYIMSMEKAGSSGPALDNYDMIIHSSTDMGISWDMISRVNQDNTGSLKYQFFPALNIDKHGGINAFYYDTRNTATNDSFQIYLSRSVDGGTSFEDICVSDHKFKLKIITPNIFGVSGYIGTYMGVTSAGNKIYPMWFDNSTEVYQAWTTHIDIGSSIKVIPQGLMNEITGKLNKKDSIRFFLRNSIPPYNKIDSAAGILDSLTFTSQIVFPNAPSGTYFLEVDGKNSLETWSAAPVSYSLTSDFTYDFTMASSQAYGNAMILVNGKWCIYSADIVHDGSIDLNDLAAIFNDQINFISGNTNTDVNGDGIVNLADLAICFNNSNNFVRMSAP
ncbi:MAG: hypothetical protein ABI462_10710 [Ignavibacteria bacterium]